MLKFTIAAVNYKCRKLEYGRRPRAPYKFKKKKKKKKATKREKAGEGKK